MEVRNLYTGSPLVNNEAMHADAYKKAKAGEIVLVHDHYYGDCRVTNRVKAAKFKPGPEARVIIDEKHVLYKPKTEESKRGRNI